jgi:drug/metabolite transporter (DMT)-like permease
MTSLSGTTVILQATPLVVVGAAALFMNEPAGWRRWSAICVGLIGVLIVLQPCSDDFSALSILAVIGMLGFAGRDLASRAAPVSVTPSVLGVYGFLTLILAGAS